MDFSHILQWRLLRDSHRFPGPDGGTCFTEAAIVAAGQKYRPGHCAEDCPPCFSRVIAGYAIVLNDSMPKLRQERLVPFVVRLPDTADTNAKEIERARYLAAQTAKRNLPLALRAADARHHAAGNPQLHDAAQYAAAAAATGNAPRWPTDLVMASVFAGYALDAAVAAIPCTQITDTPRREIFMIATAILDEAIKLGNPGEPMDAALVVSRLEAII